jgi:hypothetical protein
MSFQIKSLALAQANKGVKASNPFTTIGRQFLKIWRPPYRTPLVFAVVMQALVLFW